MASGVDCRRRSVRFEQARREAREKNYVIISQVGQFDQALFLKSYVCEPVQLSYFRYTSETVSKRMQTYANVWKRMQTHARERKLT